MKAEIKIILEENTSNKAKGNCFEELIRRLLTLHLYEVRGNINFSGMEIDLVADHKHNKESLYVECKAKEKVSSDELSKFAFNVRHKKVNRGYFYRTQELESQAGGLLSEMRSMPEYDNLTFFEPGQIIIMLSEGKLIFEPLQSLSKYNISKKILAVTYLGDFFIYLVNEFNALPTKYIVINANNNDKKVEEQIIQVLGKSIVEIKNLDLISDYIHYVSKKEGKIEDFAFETISEVQESENWFDYLPASSVRNHFVGRDDIRTKILNFFTDVRDDKTNKRIFYLNGKSGWGKSSLVLELKGRCGNKHYKNKFFALAIDTRSATSDNFVALSFKKLISSAIEKKFIYRDIFQKDITFSSTIDLLSSESINIFLKRLEEEKKYLVLIFDQFEDVFRKRDFFKTFYKFLADVTDKKPNLIIGFSWKSDFFIQSDDPSYHIWQQAKEQAREFTINEFGEKEIDGVIKQLEGSVGELDKGIKDRIKESSQGLPWLTKKLCIHIYDQIQLGLAKENLIEANLNILDLFKKDEERLSSNELKATRIIAKRAYDGNFFDETEVGDVIDGGTISSLLHKRLIIRSGANYNIYWDIYRDYIVTGTIPTIGESYLLRQGVNLCLEVFVLFDAQFDYTIEDLLHMHPKGITQETLYNILIELRNLGLVRKMNEKYSILKDIDVSKSGFIGYIYSKFQNYTPYLVLRKSSILRISKFEIVQTLKSIFKQEYQDSTWDAYAKNLISWFLFAGLDIKSRLVKVGKGMGDSPSRRISTLNLIAETYIPRGSLKEIAEMVTLVLDDTSLASGQFNRDLIILGIIDEDRRLTDFGKSLGVHNSSTLKKILMERILLFPKMIQLKKIISTESRIKSKDVISQMPIDFFNGTKDSSKIISASKALTWIR